MRVGSLFSGYGGLDMAVGGELAWYAEIEPAACKVMEVHYPGIPNLGDVTTIDWSTVPNVDVLTGGYPCQPFSTAGNRKGKNDERHLWPYVADAIGTIRPRYAVLENVRGHLTLGFADVLADLACLGVSARWGIVRAADAGAPHNRARLFIVTADWHANSGFGNGRRQEVTHVRPQQHQQASAQSARTDRHVADTASAKRGITQSNNLQTKLPRQGMESELRKRDSLSTNTSRTGTGSNNYWIRQNGIRGSNRDTTTWGKYESVITKWECITGRPAPTPTVQRNERDRLNPVFVEWMMGLPEGHVTDHGLTASQELKMLGNGVVPQQAKLALDLLGFSYE
jgi:DNA (cytosine-5)-methyltransferase 1